MITCGEAIKIRNEEGNLNKVAEMVGKAPGTVEKRLKTFGYGLVGKAGRGTKWAYQGEGQAPDDIELYGSVSPSSQKRSASKVKANASGITSDDESKVKANASDKKINNSNGDRKVKARSGQDTIDMLLVKQSSAKKRTYRGFYLDDDVLAIIDKIASGNKSDLINESLRRVFKEKGLL